MLLKHMRKVEEIVLSNLFYFDILIRCRGIKIQSVDNMRI